jgi:predicted ATPase/class 3 adenylate cyclase
VNEGAERLNTELSAGTLTFVFTDIEGSTRLLLELGNDYGPLLAQHRTLLDAATIQNGGRVMGSEGDALFMAFSDASAALRAAVEGQRALAAHPWPEGHPIRVRMGMHSGEVQRIGDEFVGLALHQTARITSAGHGGQILVSTTSRDLVGQNLPPDVSLTDLGRHRLKDLTEPERIFQVDDSRLPATFPPLRTLDMRPNNLPVQMTTFIGRAELAHAKRLLAGTRLLTLTGPGGTGKTRLALQLAGEMTDDFPDGVYFVPLDTVTEADLVASAIIAALGIEAGTQPPLDRLLAWGRNHKVLLVLDNFEQVVEGVDTVSRLLRELPDLRIVATSRIPLHAYGEQEFQVPAMELPKPGVTDVRELAHSEAVQLFMERAMGVRSDFKLTADNAGDIAEIVRQLDGLPLAIELAAARVRLLPVSAIRARLGERMALLVGGARDLPERQQTLRGAIDWSYQLLDDPDRTMFARFGIFNGGATFTAAEDVCGGPDLGRDVLEALDSLVDKSLVRSVPESMDDARFAMLVTIREYALDRLSEMVEPERTPRRHAEHFTALAEEAKGHLTGPDSRAWLDRLEKDHDNFRAAIDWAVGHGDVEIALRLGASLWRFWQIRGHLDEATTRLDRILATPGVEDAPPALHSRAEGAAGSIAYWQGDPARIHVHYRNALELARKADDRRLLAESTYNFAFAPLPDTDNWMALASAGRPYMEQALRMYRELGDIGGQAAVLWGIASPLVAELRYGEAINSLEQALLLYRQVDDSFGIGWAQYMLGQIAITQNRPQEAQGHLSDALRIFESTGDRSAQVLQFAAFAVAARTQGDTQRAWKLTGAVDTFRRTTGTDLVLTQIPGLVWDFPLEPDQADVDARRLWDEGSRMSFEDAIVYALEVDAKPA